MKKILLVLAVATVVAIIGAVPASALGVKQEDTEISDNWSYTEYGLYDVNGDKAINVKDLVRLKRYFAGDKVYLVKASADTNADSVIDTLDLAGLKTQLLKSL